MTDKSDFDKCVKRQTKGNLFSIECKRGLWSAEGSNTNKAVVEDEAMHYWRQYAHDGEYSSIIGGKSVVEMIKVNLGEKIPVKGEVTG